MNYKNTKTILFASLIVAMVLPFGRTELASAEKSIKADIKQQEKSLNKSSQWVKSLLKTDDYKSLDDDTKIKYLAFVSKLLSSDNEYQSSMVTLLEEYSEAQNSIDENKTADKSNAEDKKKKALEKLEELGITTQEKYKKDPKKWDEEVKKANKSKKSNGQVSGEQEEQPEYHLTHTGDVSIRREAAVYVLCLPGVSITCPIINIGWGSGTSYEWGLQLQSGDMGWRSESCLENSVQHSTVSWAWSAVHEANHWIFSDHAHSHSQYVTVSGSNTNCQGVTEDDERDAGYTITASSTVGYSIITTGSHA